MTSFYSAIPHLSLMNRTITFLTFFKAIHCTIYVLTGERYDTTVTSFENAASYFGPGAFQIDGPLVLASPLNACSPVDFAPNISLPTSWFHSRTSVDALEVEQPSIALIQDGDCAEDLKIWHAQQSGFSGGIVFRTVDGGITPMIGLNLATRIEIPAVLVTKDTGERLKAYTWSQKKKYLVRLTGFYSWSLKYVFICLLLMAVATVFILASCIAIHLCNSWYRSCHVRLSKRQLRRLRVKRFIKSQDPYETCAICLEDYEERQKLRLLPCHHAFHRSCIDRWLLSNRHRCPVCNRIVDFSSSSVNDSQIGLPPSLSQRLIASFHRLHWYIASNLVGLLSRTHDRAVQFDPPTEHSIEDDTCPLLFPDDVEITANPDLQSTCHVLSDVDTHALSLEDPIIDPLQSHADHGPRPPGSKCLFLNTTKTEFTAITSLTGQTAVQVDTDDDDDDDQLLSATDYVLGC